MATKTMPAMHRLLVQNSVVMSDLAERVADLHSCLFEVERRVWFAIEDDMMVLARPLRDPTITPDERIRPPRAMTLVQVALDLRGTPHGLTLGDPGPVPEVGDRTCDVCAGDGTIQCRCEHCPGHECRTCDGKGVVTGMERPTRVDMGNGRAVHDTYLRLLWGWGVRAGWNETIESLHGDLYGNQLIAEVGDGFGFLRTVKAVQS